MTASPSDRYEQLRAAAGSWIASADVKATALVAVGGALLTVVAGVVAMANGIQSFGTCAIGLFFAFCVSISASVGAAAVALLPRTNRKGLLKATAGWKPIDRSPSFFADVAALTKPAFEKLLADDDLRAADHVEQAYVTCRIATTKMRCLKVSVLAIVAALIFLLSLLSVLAFSQAGAH